MKMTLLAQLGRRASLRAPGAAPPGRGDRPGAPCPRTRAAPGAAALVSSRLRRAHVAEDQAGALVGREPAREADGERVGIERASRPPRPAPRGSRRGAAARPPRGARSAPGRPSACGGSPTARRRGRCRCAPTSRGSVRCSRQSAPMCLRVEILHRGREPGAHVHAVGDVARPAPRPRGGAATAPATTCA